MTSLFDGFARVTQWRICDGQVNFQARMLQSEVFIKSQAANDVAPEILVGGIDPCVSTFWKIAAFFSPNDNANTNLVPYVEN